MGALAGVTSVRSDFEAGEVLVEYDDAALSLSEIKGVIGAIEGGKFTVIG